MSASSNSEVVGWLLLDVSPAAADKNLLGEPVDVVGVLSVEDHLLHESSSVVQTNLYLLNSSPLAEDVVVSVMVWAFDSQLWTKNIHIKYTIKIMLMTIINLMMIMIIMIKINLMLTMTIMFKDNDYSL